MDTPVVLVTRRDERFSAFLRNGGCQVLNLELIESVPLDDLSEFAYRLNKINEYEGMFITSPVAAEVFVHELKAAGGAFTGRVYVLGERVRAALDGASLNVIYRPQANTAEELINSFEDKEFKGKRLLFIRGDKSMRTIPNLLSPKARMDEVVVYRTFETDQDESLVSSIRERFIARQIDWICFFSPSSVRSFIKMFGPEYTKNALVAVIGQTTARCARDSGFSVEFVSPKASAEEFATQLIEHIKSFDQ